MYVYYTATHTHTHTICIHPYMMRTHTLQISKFQYVSLFMCRQVYVYFCLSMYADGLPLYFHDRRGKKGVKRRRVGGEGGRMQSEEGGASGRGGR
jgi:hypothetical protein